MRRLVLVVVSLAALGPAIPATGLRGQAASGPATQSGGAASAPASRGILTSLKPEFFQQTEVKLSPAGVLGGSEPNAPGNAADDYREALTVYAANHDGIREAMEKLEQIKKGEYTVPPSVMDALQKIYAHVAAGAAKKEMHYSTPEMIQVRAAYGPGYRLYWLAKDGPLEFLFHLHSIKKNYEEMEKVLRAELVLGLHMAKEHVRPAMGNMGLEIMNRAAGTMDDLYSRWEPQKHAAAAKAAEEYAKEVNRASKEYEKKLQSVWRVVPEPDNVFAIVENDKDRAWRVEALLLCGAIRFTHSTRGHEAVVRQANKLIAEHVNDPDLFVKAAAKAAAALTMKDFEHVGDPPEP